MCTNLWEHRVRRRGGMVLAWCAVALLRSGAPACAQSPKPSKDGSKADKLRVDLREMIELARDRVFPALVNIHVVSVNYYDGKEHKSRAVGSGTIIFKDGRVLTNFHAQSEGITSDTLVDRLLEAVPAPRSGM